MRHALFFLLAASVPVSALPIMVGSLSQIFAERLRLLLGSRKRVLCLCVALQALTFVPIILAHQFPSARAEWLLAFVCCYWICGLLLGPSWSSLMGDLVPEAQRGAYFGRRSRYLQIATFIAIVAGGLLLWWYKQGGFEYGGFVAAFCLAGLARAISLGFLLLHWDPPVQSPPTRRSLTAVLDTLAHPDQRALIFYLALMSFGVYVAAPFFSAYMLRQPEQHGLQWSYVTFTLVNGITVFFKFVFLPLWGAASDRFGSRKCLVLAGWLVSALPLVWIVPHDHQALYFAAICLVQTWGGLAWAGHELCSFNFLLDSARAEDRPRLVASMNILNGLMAFLGSMTGALIVSLVPGGWNPFLVVFFCSAVTRFAVCAVLLPRLQEVRVVERISYRELFFRVSSVRATMGPVIRFFVLPAKRGGAT